MKMIQRMLLLIVAGLMLIAWPSFGQKTEIQYLSGKGKDDGVLWDFYVTGGMNANKWSKIPVPSNWQLQGFGTYNYGFDKEEKKGKEEGRYKHVFQVDPSWKGKQINIVFEGVMTDTEVKINGQLAGEIHQGSYYVFRYDISKHIKFGKDNLLEVKVAKHSANNSVNEAERNGDFWIFGGIFRPVFLEALPKAHISRVSLNGQADGSFNARIASVGKADELQLRVFDASGKQFGSTLSQAVNGDTTYLEGKFDNPELWSAEFPNLYTVEVDLLAKGKTVHQVHKKTGFRTIEIKERDGVFINGQKIKFKGVNRHSFHPESGRTTSKQHSIDQVNLIKEMNMNAVRMAHYPPDNHFLEVCDSLGLYVMNELSGWHGHYDTDLGEKLIKSMITESENSPSVIFWANGNEGGSNPELDPVFPIQDIQNRVVIWPWAVHNGFETTHYREYNYGIGTYDHGHNILMPTEFLHGMFDGGHGAGMEDYWTAIWANPLAAGGFLWDFQDQGVIRRDKDNIIDTDGNHGADGIVGPYHEKEGSFFTIKEVWSPIFFEKREMTSGFDGKFNIENRYSFTNLNQCEFSFEIGNLSTNKEFKASHSGSIDAPNISPYTKGQLEVKLPEDWYSYDVLYLTAKDPHGKEIYTWSFPITLPNREFTRHFDTASSQEVTFEENAQEFIVQAADLTYRFDKDKGQLKEVRNSKGVIPFNNGPVIQEAENNWANFSIERQGDTVVIASRFDREKSYNTLTWKIFPSGQLKMHVEYFPQEYFTRFVGANFDLPEEEIVSVKYMGRGPYRVWKNRMKGTDFGVWEKEYNDAATGEPPFVYPEFKGYHSNMYWATFNLKSQSFKVFTNREDLFLRLYTPKEQQDTDWQNMEPTFPEGDISFMNGISGIGTKTQKPHTTGPMGMKHVYYDFEKEPIRALHLELYFDFSVNKNNNAK